jgi:hypothetical protein
MLIEARTQELEGEERGERGGSELSVRGELRDWKGEGKVKRERKEGGS